MGSYISKRGFTFDYVNAFHLEKEKLKEKLINNDILSVVIPTTLYVSADPIIEIVKFIKCYNSKVKIIIGGPFILNHTFHVDEDSELSLIFKNIGADFYVCSSEGEMALVNVLNGLKYGYDISNIKNIVYKEGGKYLKTIIEKEDNCLKENKIDWQSFNKENIGDILSIRTAKSCPFSCSFCWFPQRAGKYKFLSVDDVEQQFNEIKDIGSVTTLNIIDDTFNVPPDRFKEILKMMIKNKYNFKWNSYFRCQYADRETIELMKESGCEGVYLGIESASNKIFKNMNKNAKKEDYIKGIELLNEYEIINHASFIIGFPGETDETVLETIDFIEESKPTFFRTQLWYCDHITPICKQKDKYGILGSGFQWAHDTMDVERACEWIDYIFTSVKNSNWLPQNSFDYFSIYYLQRRGMKKEQVIESSKLFNELVKNKMNRQGNYEELIGKLRKTCEF
ncbi:Fe-S oxidoreductase [Clostridium putrefaciens]|uniref:Fe-S oxidoreductase n=1 Tax=Clostridium putrefaciens TaxID=99675 RepID=A0A381J9K0_9CLOT|nr:PhpK family radical SAM P-methyltransferase [Clostridium putrefaciens]SUY47679.1 Fe-S oxidoreductase [Clostridium putrefaciens]